MLFDLFDLFAGFYHEFFRTNLYVVIAIVAANFIEFFFYIIPINFGHLYNNLNINIIIYIM